MSVDTDTITIVRANGRRLTKRIHVDGTLDDYELVRHIDLFEQEVAGLDGLARLLARLQQRANLAVVRGAVADPARTRRVRRLLHADGDEPATLVEQPRRWLALDFDDVPQPRHFDITDLTACGELAVNLLPHAFRRAGCVIQATCGHMLKGIRLRSWHWLDRPVSGTELKYWLAKVPVDRAPFGAGQLIYTAGPVLAPGVGDPVPVRLTQRSGSPSVHVPAVGDLQPPPAALTRPSAAMPAYRSPGAGHYAATILTRALVRIGRAAPGKRNPTLFAAACELAPLVRRGLLDETVVAEALTGAARRAGIDAEPHRDAASEAKKALAWALEHA